MGWQWNCPWSWSCFIWWTTHFLPLVFESWTLCIVITTRVSENKGLFSVHVDQSIWRGSINLSSPKSIYTEHDNGGCHVTADEGRITFYQWNQTEDGNFDLFAFSHNNSITTSSIWLCIQLLIFPSSPTHHWIHVSHLDFEQLIPKLLGSQELTNQDMQLLKCSMFI